MVGISAVTAATLTNTWMQIQAVIPPASSVPKRSGARSEARIPRQARKVKAEDHAGGPDQAQLLADDREDEVGVRLGKPEVLLDGVAQPDPGQAAPTQPVEGLDPLPAGVQRIGVDQRLAEAGEPAEPVGLGETVSQPAPAPTPAG